MDAPLVEFKHLYKQVRNDLFKSPTMILKDVSCAFEKGIATAVLGHNGAGKTSSLRILLGLLKADSGQVLFDGRSIKREDRRRIGYMPETNKLPMELRVEEMLYYHLNLYQPELSAKQKKERIVEQLTTVGISDKHRSKRIAFLSKGLGRRLAWAMANVHDPELLVLDEPFSGLDPLGREELAGWIANSLQKKKSVIMTTHELTSARKLCERFVIFREGSVVYQGPSSIADDRVLEYFRGVL